MDWNDVAEVRDQKRGLVNMIMNIWVQSNFGSF
jgi:hypothetical protein